MKKQNQQYVERIMQTKTAYKNSRRKKDMRKEEDEESLLITASPMLRNTLAECGTERKSPIKNG
jgi:hypothetical protein